jgi:hypothetical protein
VEPAPPTRPSATDHDYHSTRRSTAEVKITSGERRGGPTHPVNDQGLFDASEPIQKAEDLARNGVFDDGEIEQFLSDLYAMRRSDVA